MHLSFTHDSCVFKFKELITKTLNVDFLPSIPLTEKNDEAVCPVKRQVILGNGMSLAINFFHVNLVYSSVTLSQCATFTTATFPPTAQTSNNVSLDPDNLLSPDI